MYVPISPSSNPYSYTSQPLPLGTLISASLSAQAEDTPLTAITALPSLEQPSVAALAPLELMTDLVYNSRKRGGDSADRYFKATEMIAGVKDMRFQAIMPDTLHWLGVQKIDNMISMVSHSSVLDHLETLMR